MRRLFTAIVVGGAKIENSALRPPGSRFTKRPGRVVFSPQGTVTIVERNQRRLSPDGTAAKAQNLCWKLVNNGRNLIVGGLVQRLHRDPFGGLSDSTW